jgi:hypothetical protein
MFNWNIPSTPLRSDDPVVLASVVDSGKLGAVGGSSGGLLGSTAEVDITVLDIGGLGTDYCGGAIGRGGNKMCVATDCSVLSHGTAKVNLENKEHPMDTNFVFSRWILLRCL